jgi:hypothetical protein
VTAMLTVGLVWLAVAVIVALPLGRLLRRADVRQLGTTLVYRMGTEVLVPDPPAPPAAAGSPAQPAAEPPSAARAVQPAHADPTISRTS